MAEGSKQQLIEAFRLLPDGIQEFLDTPFPEVQTISTPADVDAGIIASGVLSKVLLDWLAPFAGLTPIELLTRIGQHNSVLEIAMLAGIEYMGGGDDPTPEDFAIEILSPQSGITYYAGELRLRAQGINGTLTFCECELPIHGVFELEAIGDGVFEGYLALHEPGEYTATFTGSGEGEVEAAPASVTFSIVDEESPPPGEPEPEPPGGTDDEASQVAHGRLVDALRRLADVAVRFNFNAYVRALFGLIKTYYSIWLAILRRILKGDILTALEQLITEAESLIQYVEDAIDQKDSNALINYIGKWAGVIARMAALRN